MKIIKKLEVQKNQAVEMHIQEMLARQENKQKIVYSTVLLTKESKTAEIFTNSCSFLITMSAKTKEKNINALKYLYIIL